MLNDTIVRACDFSQTFKVSEFERTMNSAEYMVWAGSNKAVLLVICVSYVAFVFLGQRFMKDRDPFKFHTRLGLWNLGLSFFSFMGVFRVAPFLLKMLMEMGIEDSLCRSPQETYGNGVVGTWCMFFAVSKVPELLDTVFLVFRKREVKFLHWYHHVSVLTYCWLAYSTSASIAIFFVTMNFFVHAVMYMYYGLQTFKMWPRVLNPIFITYLQLSQMVVGFAVCLGAIYQKHYVGRPCSTSDFDLAYGSA
eukprot:Awhi_evm1s9100